nr:glycosyltransferase family 39 protein [Salinimicrobium profundisediminis]
MSIAKTGKYGHFDASREQIISHFKANRIDSEKYDFTESTAFRPPVWPLLIAGIFIIFGYNLTYLIAFKFLLHLLGMYYFYQILKTLKVQEIIAIVGVFLYAISPAWQLYSRVFLSEPITLFFITLWLYLLVRFVKNRSGFLPQALVGGILVLAHPYYIFLPFSVWFILFLYKELYFKIFLFSSIICAAVISIWIARNFIVLDSNSLILTTSSGAVMAKGWNKKVKNEHTNTQGDLADETLVLKYIDYDRMREYDEISKMRLYKEATLAFICSNPELILPTVSRKLLSAFNPFPETAKPGILETGRWVFQLFALIAMVYLLAFSKNKLVRSLVLALIISTIGITIITYSGFRFRSPQAGLELLFMIFAIREMTKRRSLNKG